MNYSKQLIPLVAIAIGLAGCGGSGGSSGMTSGSPAPTGSSPPDSTGTPPPATPQTADFTQVVKEQVAATSETSEPIEINDTKFVFKDDDNPAAFDDVLPKAQ